MRLIIILTLFFSSFIFNNCYAQINSDLLIGTWLINERIADKEYDPIIIGGINSTVEIEKDTLTFFENGNGFEHSLELPFQYFINEDTLYMGNRTYKIISLTELDLIIEEAEKFQIIIFKIFLSKIVK
ncbi:MAG: hypothetical protein H0U27_07625 [Nitrosopumilus sp.]|nr:hypothetical protein [Nitrosopumilus sp.]